ncbi:hypothetical protein, partial [Pseudomonas sp. 2822-17]|uniref:hypothetical protein n=1 Tax=Pseudomonas sp. 2822-17 TaxID=1712678 RepID=UPI000C41291A
MQVSFLIHSKNTEEHFLEEVVETIKGEFPDTAVTVLFATIEDEHFITEYAIGYYNEKVHIQYLDGLRH